MEFKEGFTKELTEEQKKALFKLYRSYSLSNMWTVQKYFWLVMGGAALITLIDFAFVNNQWFAFFAGVANAILIFRHLPPALEENRLKFREQVIKLLEEIKE